MTYAGLNLQEMYAEAGVSELYASATPLNEEVLGIATELNVIVDPAVLEITDGERIDTETLSIPAEGSQTLRFTLDRTVMANFWVNSVPGRAVSVTITGTNFSYPSDHGLSSANSTSLKLTPGTYDVTVQDTTNYGVMPHGNDLKSRPLEFPLHMDVQPWNMRQVMGRVSLEGEEEAKEVSLRVAAFDATGQRIDFDPVTREPLTLDPTKPVVVIMHGRKDHPDSDEMKELARNLYQQDMQVVMVDWSEAAKDFISLPGDFPLEEGDFGHLRDARWTPAVGKWVAQQLLAARFAPKLIQGIGESHGAYGAFFMGEEVLRQTGEKIGALVALDPAKNPFFVVSNEISEADIQFDKVASKSWAIISSKFGSEEIADTANTHIDVSSPDRNSWLQAPIAHRHAGDLFANIIARGRAAYDGAGGDDVILQSEGGILVHKPDGSFDVVFDKEIHVRTGAEAVITVDFEQAKHENGEDWLRARFQEFFVVEEGSNSGQGS